jgi:hypothetical protein
MALSSEQKSSRLFKKALGAGETLISRQFFEEPKLGSSAILPEQIWTEAVAIPSTAPTLSGDGEDGVVKYLELLELEHVAGSQDLSYFSSDLIDTIPFNFGDGSYNYGLFKNNGTTVINFGEGDWLLDTSAGLLTFYGSLPSGVNASNPPKISFYKYIGTKGLGTSSLQPVYQTVSPSTTHNGTASLTSIVLTQTPSIAFTVEIYVNGQRQSLGETNTSNCWFGTVNSAILFTNLSSNDAFVWNADGSGFELDTDDIIDIVYAYEA